MKHTSYRSDVKVQLVIGHIRIFFRWRYRLHWFRGWTRQVNLPDPTSLPRFQTISISAWEIGWKLPSLLILHTISFHSMDMLDVDMASYFVSCRYVGVAIKLTRSVLIIFRIWFSLCLGMITEWH